MKVFVYLKGPPLIWCWCPVWKARADCQQDRKSKMRLWADILQTHTHTEKHTRAQHKQRKPTVCATLKLPKMLLLMYDYRVAYHSPRMPPATAGCGGDTDTEWRAAPAARPAPDSSLSSRTLGRRCTATSTDRDQTSSTLASYTFQLWSCK